VWVCLASWQGIHHLIVRGALHDNEKRPTNLSDFSFLQKLPRTLVLLFFTPIKVLLYDSKNTHVIAYKVCHTSSLFSFPDCKSLPGQPQNSNKLLTFQIETCLGMMAIRSIIFGCFSSTNIIINLKLLVQI